MKLLWIERPAFSSSLLVAACLAVVACFAEGRQSGADPLAERFRSPPPSARPWVYWFPLDGNITREGITADLEAMQRAGIGGVLYMETAQGTPKGPAPFASRPWRDLIHHACQEASRLGLEINMNNDAGWCGSGGPWITPELSMQRVVWTETQVAGPKRLDAVLPQPKVVKDFYRDIGVFAFPTPAKSYQLPQLRGKTLAAREAVSLRTSYPELPAESVVSRRQIMNLTAKLAAGGRLAWDVPAGNWTLLRLGHTTTGKDNHPAPEAGRGLECDKLSKEAAETHFRNLMGKLIEDNRALAGQNKTLVATHIDSWEVGSQNWTPRFCQEFQRLRGYDPVPLLPVMSGCVVDSLEVSERFLWDVRRTIADLLLANYAGHMRELAHRSGLRLSIEAYGDGPLDDLPFAGRADEPMAEFWSWTRFGAAETCTAMASAAHVYGKPILGAEAFTATDAEKWLGHPGNIKDLGDWAFCQGINRFVFHRYALQPWKDVRPGVSMGPWGLHYERTQTWWEQSRAWHAYLARCQFLLQQGRFVADLCFLQPENAPQDGRSPVKGNHERPGHNFDICPAEVVLQSMQVKDGRLVLPDGMSYRMLVLPRTGVMTPSLVRKIRDLVAAGATVLGCPPAKSPSLVDYPACDAEVRAVARELWGDGEPPAGLTSRPFGQGHLIWGREVLPPPEPPYQLESALHAAKWIWFHEGHPQHSAPAETRYFRRVVTLEPGGKVASARLVMTADNEFTCWVNGRTTGHGDRFQHAYGMNVGHLLKPGANVIAVAATNTTTSPNPAGLIGALSVKFADGRKLEVLSDEAWQASKAAEGTWKTAPSVPSGWTDALPLGPAGMAPWGEIEEAVPGVDPTLDIAVAGRAMAQLGVAPDFACRSAGGDAGLRYIHKRIGDADVYFVANKDPLPREFVCSFRVAGRRPELWHPDTGEIQAAAAFEQAGACTQVPIRFEPSGSVFVVFRQPVAGLDPVVSASHNGRPFLPLTEGTADLMVRKAVYGILDDPARCRDVTAKVQALMAKGTTSFPVADMAQGDDPAYGEVKTLQIEYQAHGESLTASSTDGHKISVNIPAGEEVAAIHRGADGSVTIEAGQPGAYQLRTASGKTLAAEVSALPPVLAIAGEWKLDFPPRSGAPEHVVLPKLISWSEHADAGVRYFSGTATYHKTFDVTAAMLGDGRRLCLDLGQVAIMAEVTLNGRKSEALWRRPFAADVTRAVRPGQNVLEIRVVNLWVNRLIGDEQLPDDSPRQDGVTLKAWPAWLLEGKPSPTGRYTFTSHRLWKKDDPLQPSGLIGPVVLKATQIVKPSPGKP